MKILLVGAGLANASLIHFIRKKFVDNIELFRFDVIDQRSNIGGNCYTKICEEAPRHTEVEEGSCRGLVSQTTS